MTPNLDDIVALRMTELTRIIAGCTSLYPLEILPLLTRLSRSDLTDIHARKYLLSLKAKYNELSAAKEELRVTICVDVATSLGLLPDFAGWINLVDSDPLGTVKQSIQEINDLKTTLSTLIALKPFIIEVIEASEWR